jgi:hypothetical protein
MGLVWSEQKLWAIEGFTVRIRRNQREPLTIVGQFNGRREVMSRELPQATNDPGVRRTSR